MAEIVLDDTKIAVPKKLKILSFLAEIQKKAPNQFLYVVNDKDICIFENLDQVRKGMWRRYKLPDIYGHYYIDPENLNEIIVFSEDLANKLGSFPYEGPPLPSKQVPQSDNPFPTQSMVQKQNVMQRFQTQQSSVVPSVVAQNSVQPSAFQSTIPTTLPSISQAIQQSALQAPVTPMPLSPPPQMQQYSYNNSLSTTNTSNNQHMNPKSIDNLNRILSYQQSIQNNNRTMNFVEQQQKLFQNWNNNTIQNITQTPYQNQPQQAVAQNNGAFYSNMSAQPQFQPQPQPQPQAQNNGAFYSNVPSQTNTNYPSLIYTPQSSSFAQTTQLTNPQQTNPQLTNPQPTNQPTSFMQNTQVVSQPNLSKQKTVQTQPTPLTNRPSAQKMYQNANSLYEKSEKPGDEKTKYFPAYQKKKSTAPGPAPNRSLQIQNSSMSNVAPQTVQSQFTA
jgi:hypothetical protein